MEILDDNIEYNYMFFLEKGKIKHIAKFKPIESIEKIKEAVKKSKMFLHENKVSELVEKKLIELIEEDPKTRILIFE